MVKLRQILKFTIFTTVCSLASLPTGSCCVLPTRWPNFHARTRETPGARTENRGKFAGSVDTFEEVSPQLYLRSRDICSGWFFENVPCTRFVGQYKRRERNIEPSFVSILLTFTITQYILEMFLYKNKIHIPSNLLNDRIYHLFLSLFFSKVYFLDVAVFILYANSLHGTAENEWS